VVRVPAGVGNFSLHHDVPTGSGAHPDSYPMVPGTLSLGVKRPGREADHSPPSSSEVKNAWNYTSTLQYAFMAWCSVKAQGQLYLHIKVANKFFDNAANFRYMVQVVTKQNYIHDETTSKLISWNTCYHSVEKFLYLVSCVKPKY
jgi:hypothetical protein